MEFVATVRKTGGSLVLTIPTTVCDLLKIKENEILKISIQREAK